MSTETLHTEDSNQNKPIWKIFIVGLLMLALFWLLVKLLLNWSPEGANDDAAAAEVRLKNLAELRASNEVELNQYGWVDQQKGIVRIPIADAMNLVTQSINQQAPRAAYPVQAAAPVAAPAPEAPAPSTPEAVEAAVPATEAPVQPAADAAPAEPTPEPSTP